ncbi:MAG: hypothetical protein AAFS11_03655 [Planctomycetota bacterium]
MSPQKLLELALLDASGVLDPAESAEFERCFAEADADLKAQVRREQARFADVSEILPDVTPRPELRSLVLDAVRDASGKHRDQAGSVILAHAAQERSASTHRRSRGAVAWRVATFAFATAFAAVGVMAFQLNQQFTEVSDSIARNERIDTLLDLGQHPDFLSALLDESYQRSPFITGESDVQASVFVSDTEGVGYVAFRRLAPIAPGSSYVLVAIGDDDQDTIELARFGSAGETSIIEFEYDQAIGSQFAVAVVDARGDFEILFRTATA